MKKESGLRRITRRTIIFNVASILLIVVVWQIIGSRLPPIFLSTPVRVVHSFDVLLMNGDLGLAFLQSLEELAIGFVIVVAVGIPVGLLMGRYKIVYAFLDWPVSVFNAMPIIMLLPILIVWFGVELNVKIAIIILSSIFTIVINTESGVRNTDNTLVEVAKVYGASERQILRRVVVPAMVPYMVTGLRLGLARALIGVVVAELLTATTGLGGLITFYGNLGQTSYFFAPVLVYAALAIVLQWPMRSIERRFSGWKVEASR